MIIVLIPLQTYMTNFHGYAYYETWYSLRDQLLPIPIQSFFIYYEIPYAFILKKLLGWSIISFFLYL